MKADQDGWPKAGRSARELGVRIDGHADIAVSDAGEVRPRTGGMSVALDDYRHLPVHRLPPPLGSGRDPVYRLTTVHLSARLTLRADGHQHGLVEPSVICTLED